MKKKQYPKLKCYPDGGKYSPINYDDYYKQLNSYKTLPVNPKTGLIDTPKSLRLYAPTLSSNLQMQQSAMNDYMKAGKYTSLTPEQGSEALSKAGYGNYDDYLKNANAWEAYRNKTVVPGQKLDQSVDISGTYNSVMGGGINMTPTTPYDSTHSQKMFPKNTVTNIQPHKYGGRQLPKYEEAGIFNPADPNRPANGYIPETESNSGVYSDGYSGETYGMPENPEMSGDTRNTGQKIQGSMGWMAYAQMGKDVAKGAVQRDDTGRPISNTGAATDQFAEQTHKTVMNESREGDTKGVFREALGVGKVSRGLTNLLGKDQETTGFWGWTNKNNDNAQYSNYQGNGSNYAHGGMHKGMPNAEVEKQEMMRMPDGSTSQVNGPSHENGGVAVNIPTGTQIFSDRLKNPETKKTFAKEAAKYKIKEGDKLSATEQLKNSLRQKKLDQIFQAQESLKQSKVAKYAEKMGVSLGQEQFSKGGTKLPQYAGTPPYITNGTYEEQAPFMSFSERAALDMENSRNPEFAGYNTPRIPQSNNENMWSMPIIDPEEQSHYNEAVNNSMQLKPVPKIDYSNLAKSTSNEERDNSNMRDNAGLAANILGQNVGNIADLYMTRFGKKYDKESYGQLTPQKLDPTQALIDADIQNKITRGALAGAADGNAGAYMSNAIQAGAQNALAKARIRMGYDKENVDIFNKFLPINKQLEMQEISDTKQNKARSEDIARTALRGMGTNTAAAISDFKKGKMDKYALDLISKAYPDYEYDSKKRVWKHKVSGKKLEV